MDGFINLLKPTGMTSHDVVSVIRRMLGQRKTGHTGTLDPMAVGVLPVGLGIATKITQYLDQDIKKYRCEMRLGWKTDTGDIWGVLQEKKEKVFCSLPEIREAAAGFRGEMLQVPPMYSAVRVNGKRLYEYARNGEEVEVKARKVTIRSLEIKDYYDSCVLFDVECSKGTYVRSICTQMGELLGCGAAMSFLARTASGAFQIRDTVTLEEIQEHLASGRPAEELLLPVDYPVGQYGMIRLGAREGKKFVNGGQLKYSLLSAASGTLGPYYRIYEGNTFLGMATVDEERDRVIAHKVFYRQL